MRLTVAIGAVRTRKQTRVDLTGVLSSADIKFLKKWCIDGSTSRENHLPTFVRIRKNLTAAGLYTQGKEDTIYRGVNLSPTQFEKLVVEGKLTDVKASVASWTRDVIKASQYAKGAMKAKPGAVCVILKKKKGTYASDVVLDLVDVARLIGSHFGVRAVFNKEIILKSKPITLEDVAFIFEGPPFSGAKGKMTKSLAKLADRGLTGPNLILDRPFLKVSGSGKLVNAKRPTSLKYA